MKTATKILLTAFILLIIALIVLMVFIRKGLYTSELAVGKGEVIKSEEHMSEAFHSLELQNTIHVYLKQDTAFQEAAVPQNRVVIEAHENLIPLVKTEVEDGRLRISLKENIRKRYAPQVYIYVADLQEIEASRGVTLESVNMISGKSLLHDLQLGAKSTLDLNFDDLELRLRLGAHTTLTGTVNSMRINSSHGAYLDASGLKARHCDIQASMGTFNHMSVAERIMGEVSQGSVLVYSGSPDVNELAFRSGGQVNQIDR